MHAPEVHTTCLCHRPRTFTLDEEAGQGQVTHRDDLAYTRNVKRAKLMTFVCVRV